MEKKHEERMEGNQNDIIFIQAVRTIHSVFIYQTGSKKQTF